MEQTTISSYDEMTAKDEADDSRTVNATSREVATKNDIKEVAMDNMAKVIDQRRMESSTLVLETWAVASEN